MPNHKKFASPTILKNIRIPVALNNWMIRKSRITKTSQVDLVLDAMKARFPEVKKILS